jgi:hypothetical protein
VPQGVRRGRFLHPGGDDRALEGALERLIEEVMPPAHAGARIHAQRGLREHPVPGPGLRRARDLARQRLRQLDTGHLLRAIALP